MSRTRRAGAALLAAAVVLSFTACGGDDEENEAAATHTTNPTLPSQIATAAAEPVSPESGAVVEVQGIVGSVDQAQRTIQINRLQGAEVDYIELSTSTRIRSATGGTVRLSDIRPSDRIVARGRVQGASLVATEVTVSQVVPGSQPGG